MLMQMMGMIKMIAGMMGSDSALVGWAVHLAISAMFGIGYALVFGRFNRPWLGGLIYGFIWYVLGPLTLMPLMTGMGLQWSVAGVTGSMPSLMGHLIYGLVLGLVFGWLEKGAPAGAQKAGHATR
jgi:uncharacterized membrane protein YagU involved in acid resistance